MCCRRSPLLAGTLLPLIVANWFLGSVQSVLWCTCMVCEHFITAAVRIFRPNMLFKTVSNIWYTLAVPTMQAWKYDAGVFLTARFQLFVTILNSSSRIFYIQRLKLCQNNKPIALYKMQCHAVIKNATFIDIKRLNVEVRVFAELCGHVTTHLLTSNVNCSYGCTVSTAIQ